MLVLMLLHNFPRTPRIRREHNAGPKCTSARSPVGLSVHKQSSLFYFFSVNSLIVHGCDPERGKLTHEHDAIFETFVVGVGVEPLA